MTKRFARWTNVEVAALRQVYPQKGTQGVMHMFPHRSRVSIQHKACTLGLKYAPERLFQCRPSDNRMSMCPAAKRLRRDWALHLEGTHTEIARIVGYRNIQSVTRLKRLHHV